MSLRVLFVLFVGIVSLVSNASGQGVYGRSYGLSFGNVPQLAVAICAFSTPVNALINDNTFYVIPLPSRTMLQVKSRSVTLGWTAIRVTYLASENPELLLDTLSTRKPYLMQKY